MNLEIIIAVLVPLVLGGIVLVAYLSNKGR
jgi:hypothetical protein